MKIGIFDSGIGGLSVLHEAYHQLPGAEFIFYADVAHVPYGLKTPDQIKGYVREIIQFLMEQKVDAIVIACNTATAVAIEDVRNSYGIPILGMEPAVKPAIEETSEKRIMVMATPVTIREDKLQHLLQRVDETHRVDLLPMPGLVEFAEKEIFEGQEVEDYLQSQLANYDLTNYSALVLGCTHFNYFKPSYHHYFDSKTLIVDGNLGTIRHLSDVLQFSGADGVKEPLVFTDIQDMVVQTNTTYYFSGEKVEDEKSLSLFLRLHNRLELVRNA